MDECDVAIIGAGLAGLATGIYAQRNGYRSHIFEHHTQAGGVAASWQRGDYLIDGGIHFSMGHTPGSSTYELYEQLGIAPDVPFVEMDTYGLYHHEPSGASILVTRDLARLRADLVALSPEDKDLVDDVIDMAEGLRGVDMGTVGLAKPPELSGIRDTLSEYWSSRGLMRHVLGKGGTSVRDAVSGAHDARLQGFFEALFMPEAPLYLVAMVLALLADGELAFLEGGCRDFVGALERRYRSLGGRISFDATVERVLVEGDRATGVRLSDGSEHAASAVVSAADGRSTIFRMLRGAYVDDSIEHRYATWKVFPPFVMVTFGVAESLRPEAALTMLRLAQPLIVGPDVVDDVLIRTFSYSDRFAPPGKTVVQVELETEWSFWSNLSERSPDRYQDEKDRIATAALARLQRHFPGIDAAVEVTDVVTPMAIWHYTRNHRAAWEGWAMTPSQVQATLPRTLPGLDRFYMAGQWVMPGGGVLPCLHSGRHAIQLLCRDDGRPFGGER